MSEFKSIYGPEDIRSFYPEIVPAYQKAFEGNPWNEVSKCPDTLLRCAGGLSAIAVGNTCDTCGLCPIKPAYQAAELIERFDRLGETRPTAWYIERGDEGVTLAAVAWRATPSQIVAEKYSDVPEMAEWFGDRLSSPAERVARRVGMNPKERQIMWLDEVFANRDIKPKGNLQNFGSLVTGLAARLGTKFVAYRTIEPRMVAAARRDFGYNAAVMERERQVPDRRDFIVVKAKYPVNDGWGMA